MVPGGLLLEDCFKQAQDARTPDAAGVELQWPAGFPASSWPRATSAWAPGHQAQRIPAHTEVRGSGFAGQKNWNGDASQVSAGTFVWAANKVEISCEQSPGDGRIGFILGDDTKVHSFTYVSLGTVRFGMDSAHAGLCGGAVFETPGCTRSDCDAKGGGPTTSFEGNPSIDIAEVYNVFLTGAKDNGGGNYDPASDDCESAPQVALYMPWSADSHNDWPSSNVEVHGVTMYKSWADGINVHGSSHDVKIHKNHLWMQGDDNIGL